MSTLLDFATNSAAGRFQLKAGVDLLQNALLQLGPDGQAYPVAVTDYAAVANITYGTAQTNAATGQIVAQTSIVAVQTLAFSRQAVAQGSDGSIYTHTSNSVTVGMRLTKYAASGALIARVTIDAADAYVNQQLLLLSNGNIALLAVVSGAAVKYAIYDSNLNVVKALTAFAETTASTSGRFFAACALSGGGFAAVYQQSANALLSRLVTYDNTGTIVQAATTVWTRTGTTGAQYHRMAQLSNGNLIIAVHSDNTVSSIGLYQGVVTVAGASVSAFASIHAYAQAGVPEVSVMTGFYCVAGEDTTSDYASVFNNAGALQGAGFVGASGTNSNRIKLVNDGVNFWFIWPRGSDSTEQLTKLPTSGTGYVTTTIALTGIAYNYYVDAFYENGFIVAVLGLAVGGANAPQIFVLSTTTGMLVSTSATTFGTAPSGASGNYYRIIPGGDFSFICMYDYSSTAATNLCVGKYANTAIMGAAQAAASAGATVSLSGTAGAYIANYLNGSASKQFDHSATNIYGNKGALLNYGAVLKGF